MCRPSRTVQVKPSVQMIERQRAEEIPGNIFPPTQNKLSQCSSVQKQHALVFLLQDMLHIYRLIWTQEVVSAMNSDDNMA